MYKKHGRDREANLELQVKALVVKALEEQRLSMEPRTLMASPGELALVSSPSEPPSIAYGNQLVARWCFLVAGRTL